MSPLYVRLRVVLLAGIALVACGPSEGPEVVARAFWDAVAAGDFERAHALSTAPDAARIEAALGPESRWQGAVAIGRTLESTSSALVECTTRPNEGYDEVAFNTHLTLYGDVWRVDLRETVSDLRAAAFGAVFAGMAESLEEGGEALREAIEESALEAAEALREAIDEMQRNQGSPTQPAPRAPHTPHAPQTP